MFSIQALVPLFASISVPITAAEAVQTMKELIDDLARAYEHTDREVRLDLGDGDRTHYMLAMVHHDRLAAILERVLDTEQFLSPHGVRSLSKYHRDQPYVYHLDGRDYSVDYTPAESSTRMFGGNSNWRGPIWMPMNFMFLQALNAYARFFGDTFLFLTRRTPLARPHSATLAIASLGGSPAGRARQHGRRAVFGENDYFQSDPHWRDLVPFYEYFDGDTGRGLGASHQTGWTAMIALLLQFRGALRFDSRGDLA